jgi:hypothetical protein
VDAKGRLRMTVAESPQADRWRRSLRPANRPV